MARFETLADVALAYSLDLDAFMADVRRLSRPGDNFMTSRLLTIAALTLAFAVPVSAGPTPADPARTITIQSGDDMKFSVTRITAARGERLRIVLGVTGTMPKTVMGHNVVVLKKGADVAAFVNASAVARTSGFVAPAFAPQILAATPLAGPRETVEVTFDVPKVPGTYEFVCSFPGHYMAGMKGVIVVK
jgi:azurin